MKEYNIHVQFWNKGDKFECPTCHKEVSEPYICKCGTKLNIKVRLNNGR